MTEKEIKELDKKFEKMSSSCANSVWRGTGTGLKRNTSKKVVKKTKRK